MMQEIALVLGIYLLLTTFSSPILADSAYSCTTDCKNNYPIIGILSQPSHSHEGNCGGDCLYIAASYVKYIESAGARAVPINYYADESELEILFESLNGFLWPGGGNNFPPSAQYIFDRTLQANDEGDFMPLQGTCLGFEWLIIAASGNQSILDPPYGSGDQLDAYNLSIPLDFTTAAADSRLFANAWGNLYTVLETQNVTMNNHHYGIYPGHFMQTPALSTFYNMLSTNKDRRGTEFVSTVEAFDYPIYGLQWHPEKNAFEWGMTVDGIPKEAINHSPYAIEVEQYMADFLVQQARNSTHKFSSPTAEASALIYNYPVTHTSGSFVQEYFFANDFSSVSTTSDSPSSKGTNWVVVIVVPVAALVVLLGFVYWLTNYSLYAKYFRSDVGQQTASTDANASPLHETSADGTAYAV